MADGFKDSNPSGSFAVLEAPPSGDGNPSHLDQEFSRFYSEQYRNVRAFLARRMPPDAVEDLTQDVFVRAYEGFAAFEKRGIAAAEWTWAATIALRLWHNRFRDTKKERDLTADFGDPDEAFDPPDKKTPDHGRRLIAKDLVGAIPLLMSRLPPGQREVLALWLEGKSYDAICRQSGKSLQNVRATIHKARLKLAESLERLGDPRTQPEPTH